MHKDLLTMMFEELQALALEREALLIRHTNYVASIERMKKQIELLREFLKLEGYEAPLPDEPLTVNPQ